MSGCQKAEHQIVPRFMAFESGSVIFDKLAELHERLSKRVRGLFAIRGHSPSQL
jgi:hypothetical protein